MIKMSFEYLIIVGDSTSTIEKIPIQSLFTMKVLFLVFVLAFNAFDSEPPLTFSLLWVQTSFNNYNMVPQNQGHNFL